MGRQGGPDHDESAHGDRAARTGGTKRNPMAAGTFEVLQTLRAALTIRRSDMPFVQSVGLGRRRQQHQTHAQRRHKVETSYNAQRRECWRNADQLHADGHAVQRLVDTTTEPTSQGGGNAFLCYAEDVAAGSDGHAGLRHRVLHHR